MSRASLVMSPTVQGVIRSEAFRAWRSLRRFGYEPADLRQELTLDCLGRFDRYDPSRSSPATFATHTCRQRTLQIVEPALAAKRNGGVVPQSLSSPLREDDGVLAELASTISEGAVAARLGRRSRPAEDLTDLHLDVERLLNGLPSELTVVARLLLAGERNVAVARQLRISHATLYRRIAQLRQAFRNAGLHAYNTPEAA
jgi:hypothetical protein